jgi:hypothetical protein
MNKSICEDCPATEQYYGYYYGCPIERDCLQGFDRCFRHLVSIEMGAEEHGNGQLAEDCVAQKKRLLEEGI